MMVLTWQCSHRRSKDTTQGHVQPASMTDGKIERDREAKRGTQDAMFELGDSNVSMYTARVDFHEWTLACRKA